jgi:outer membrane protein OmpA-like peptidoglycan-associated protein
MKTINRNLALAMAMVGMTASGSILAEETFPVARDRAESCDSMKWHKDMATQYPRVIAACQEVVTAEDGTKWARFGSKFDRVDNDGTLNFAISGANDRNIQDVTLTPGVNQVAYIDGRETEFKDLRKGQTLNLYMPEGSAGFATEVGGEPNKVASIRNDADAENQRLAAADKDSKQFGQKLVTMDSVQFSLNSAELTPDAKAILDEHAREFSDNADTKYLIAGHASASASQEYNQALSERRAQAVLDYLVNEGNVDAERLSMIGYGETQPIAREASNGAANSKAARTNMRVGFELASR